MKHASNILLASIACLLFSMQLVGQEAEQIADDDTRGCFSSSSGCAACPPSCTLIKKLPATIKEPGCYCLCSSIDTNNCASVAITVASSDVVVDLSGFSLLGGVRGIQVAAGMSNVIIRNGTITNMLSEGILVMAGCDDIVVDALQVINCNQAQCGGVGGIIFKGLSASPCTNCSVRNCLVTSCQGAGVSMQFCNTSKVENNCVFSIASSPVLDAVGFYVSGKYNLIKNDKASQIVAADKGTSAFGFLIDASDNSLVTLCETSNNSVVAPAVQAIGFDVRNSSFIAVKDCLSNANKGSNPTLGCAVVTPNVRGFQSEDSESTIFSGCTACGNTVTGGNVVNGFLVTGFGDGFVLNADSKSYIFDCTASLNSFAGFLLFCTSANCAVGKSKALDNQVVGFAEIVAESTLLTCLGNTTNRFYWNVAAQNNFGTNNYLIVNSPAGPNAPVVTLGVGPEVVGQNICGVIAGGFCV